MNPRRSLSLFFMLLSSLLGAQTYHFQYTHDTIGNRVSRIYQTSPSKGGASFVEMSGVANLQGDEAFKAAAHNDSSSLSVATAGKDTVKCVPPYKSPAEKAAYLEAMMDEIDRQKPYPVDGDVRDVSNYSVGEIALSYGISGSGARTYSIPIYTAPDIKYAPALSLVYNSQGGYGYGGYGWDMGGLSSITLSRESLYWDDNISAASTAEYDCVFCLDGIRLVRNTNSATKSTFPLVTATGPRVLVAPIRGQSSSAIRIFYWDPANGRQAITNTIDFLKIFKF